MGTFRWAGIAAFVFSASLAAFGGTQPAVSVSQYPAHAERDGASIGARLLTPDQLQHEIAADLKRCCLVVEFAVYPSKQKPSVILPEEFSLRIVGIDKAIKPASSRLVASILHNSDHSPHDADAHGSVSIGYETASARDPNGNRERASGVTTDTQVAVGSSPSGKPPVPTDQDRMSMELELSSKSLPEGSTTVAVAGYLYFPLAPKKQKNKSGYQLETTLTGQKTTLTLSPP
jgi:hypothetical protein